MNQAAPALIGPSRRGLSKAAHVYEYLRSAIVTLEIAPGTRIDKTTLCSTLGVSRQPLAEAIARLAEERLLDVEPQKGTFVARIRLSDVLEASFVRHALEVQAVRTLAPTITQDTLAQLDRSLTYQGIAVEAGDADEFYALDLGFHQILLNALSMSRVSEVIETSRAQLERGRRLLLPSPGRSDETLQEHKAIFDALSAHDPDAAADAMSKHLNTVTEGLRQFATSRPGLFER